MLLSCKESGPKPSSQATHKYTEDVVFWVLRPVFWHFDFSVAIAGNKYEQGQSTCEVVFPCEWLLFWESDMRGGKLRVFLPTLSFILHYHFVLASSQRGCWGSVVCGPTTLPFWRGKRKTGLVPHSLCVLPLFGHLQLSTELPGQPLHLGLEWSRGVEYGDLKPFEKELNLPVTRYSNVTKWCWFLLFFFFFWTEVLFCRRRCCACMRVVFWVPARSVVRYEIVGLRDEWVEAYPWWGRGPGSSLTKPPPLLPSYLIRRRIAGKARLGESSPCVKV